MASTAASAKELTAFAVNRRMADGLLNECRDCRSAYQKEWYRLNAERVRQRVKSHRDEHIEAARAYDRARGYRHPGALKLAAYNAVHIALDGGHLVRLPCIECGSPQSDAHHDDYSKPLDVIWLCRAHHMARHRTYA